MFAVVYVYPFAGESHRQPAKASSCPNRRLRLSVTIPKILVSDISTGTLVLWTNCTLQLTVLCTLMFSCPSSLRIRVVADLGPG